MMNVGDFHEKVDKFYKLGILNMVGNIQQIFAFEILPSRLHAKNIPNKNKKSKEKRKKMTSCRRCKRCHLSKLIIIVIILLCCMDKNNCQKIRRSENKMRCPNTCACFSEYTVVYCNNQSLENVPLNIPKTAKKISLAFNNIRSIDRVRFQRLNQTEMLDLKENLITTIETGAFFGMTNIIYLNLTKNKLTTIPSSLGELPQLRELRLRGNPIVSIITSKWISLKSLLKLDIGELRHLSRLSPKAFYGLKELQILKMDSCNLSEVPNLMPLKSLTELDLSANQFQIIPVDAFSGLNKLQHLRLDSCEITSINKAAFSDLVSLRYLNLMRNNLVTLNASLFANNHNLLSIHLRYNLWICDCNLMSLAGYLAENKNLCNEDQCPVCQSPGEYKGKIITVLKETNTPPCTVQPTLFEFVVSEDRPAKFPCPSRTKEKAKEIKWYMPNGTRLTRKNFNGRVKKIENGLLSFTRVTQNDMGAYTCSVTSQNNEVVNGTVHLKVISTQPAMLTSSTKTSIFTTTTTRIINSSSTKQNPSTITSRADIKTTSTTKVRTTRKRFTTTKIPPTSSRRTSTTFSSTKRTQTPTLISPNRPTTTTVIVTQSEEVANTKQGIGTTNIIIGCFIALTIIAALLLLILYKLRRKSNNLSRNSSAELSESKSGSDKNISDFKKSCAAASFQPHLECYLSSPDNENKRSKNAMAESITSTWVAALPEGGNIQSTNIPPSAVRVLPPSPTAIQKRQLERQQKFKDFRKSQAFMSTTDILRPINPKTMTTECRNCRCLHSNKSVPSLHKSLNLLTLRGNDVSLPNGRLTSTENATEMRQFQNLQKANCRLHLNETQAKQHQNLKLRYKSCANLTQHQKPQDTINHVRFENDSAIAEKSIKTNGLCKTDHGSCAKTKLPVKTKSLEGLFMHMETEI